MRGAVGRALLMCILTSGLLASVLAAPAAAQGGYLTGGAMRFSTEDVAFGGGYGGLVFDLWRVEPYGYLSYDAGVWAVQTGIAFPIVRLEVVRLSVRFGSSTAFAGPAIEPDFNPTVGFGVRLGRELGVVVEMDRAEAFTLTRAGLFIGW